MILMICVHCPILLPGSGELRMHTRPIYYPRRRGMLILRNALHTVYQNRSHTLSFRPNILRTSASNSSSVITRLRSWDKSLVSIRLHLGVYLDLHAVQVRLLIRRNLAPCAIFTGYISDLFNQFNQFVALIGGQ